VNVLDENSLSKRHIPTSINIPVEEIPNKGAYLLPDPNQEIIVYCSSRDCSASPDAGKKLEQMGYKNVTHFMEGLAGWKQEKFSFEGSAVK